jgi:serine/threonine protein kinase/formylglycine-generating enzyme required for sulfatase activity
VGDDRQDMSNPDDEKTRLSADGGQAPEISSDEVTVAGGSDSVLFSDDAPRQVGDYRLLQLIGSGGQGDVYLAEDTKLGRKVALKLLGRQTIFLDDMSRSRLKARFEREAEVAARLQHPGICAVHAYGESDGIAWIAMQYVSGRPLNAVLKSCREAFAAGDISQPMLQLRESSDDAVTPQGGAAETRIRGALDSDDISQSPTIGVRPAAPTATAAASSSRNQVHAVIRLIEDTAEALQVAHDAGLVHRDIKPGNLMLSDDGRAVILDFGLAQDRSESAQTLTMTGEIMGTPAYMPPEQMRGERDKIGVRSDVYSLGATLYEALTLKRPFDAPTHDLLFRKIANEEPADVRALNSAISRDLATVVACAMDKVPERRYRSARAFAEDLRRVRRYEPILARPVGPATRAWRWVQRNPIIASMTFALILALSAVAGIFIAKSAELAGLNSELKNTADAKTAALMEYERMADTRRLVNAKRDASALWPESPAQIPALEAWQSRYASLATRLEEHRVARDTLRAEARVITQNETESFDFGDDVVAEFRHQVLSKLVADLEEFCDPKSGVIASVQKRLERSRLIEAATQRDQAEAWRVCIKRLGQDARFAAIADSMEAQLGLIPLGPDPQSGLEEFLDWRTHAGEIPRRGPNGRITLTEDTGIIFVLLPGGTYLQGAQNDDPNGQHYEPNLQREEAPMNEHTLDPFFLSKYEVTQDQWARMMGDYPANFPKGKQMQVHPEPITGLYPVERVNWARSVEFTRRLGLLLPTEAQWEYAARGTGDHRFSGTSDPSRLGEYANLSGIEGAAVFPNHTKTHEDSAIISAAVGSFLPNGYGLHDMTGNVEEWAREATHFYADIPAAPGDGYRDSSRGGHMARGGSFNEPVREGRVTWRKSFASGNASATIGIRPSRMIE